ncbi:MAG: hypothetical protein AB1705_19210, partial [Verrucomicrobiota bacterium]
MKTTGFGAMGLTSDRAENLGVGLAVALFVGVLCFTPPSLFESMDYILFYKPNFHFLIENIRSGNVPFWNPYVGLGRP